MLLAIVYVLCVYAFVVWLLYMWNQESPPERMDKDVNTVIAVKGLKHDRDKSNSHTISRTHTQHDQVN